MSKFANLSSWFERPESIPADEIPLALGEVERIRAVLWARLVSGGVSARNVAPVFPATSIDEGPDHLLNVSDLMKLLGVGKNSVYELIARGELPAIRFGRSIRVSRKAVSRWIDRHR